MKRLVWIFLVFLLASPAWAQQKRSVSSRIGDMFSPGKLIEGHANLESAGGCLNCHDINSGVDKKLCLKCHLEIGDQEKNAKGFHASELRRPCLDCHTDHKGRDAKVYNFKGFDHAKLVFAADGAHRDIDCQKCHQSKFQSDAVKKLTIGGVQKKQLTYLGLNGNCAGCHGKPHKEQFQGQNCQDCHNQIAWKLTKFDHAQAKFTLEGKHQNVSCIGCHHKSEKYPEAIPFANLGTQCSVCHQDVHDKRHGDQCDSCHKPTNWKQMKDSAKVEKFDHELTRFPLAKLHKEVKCESCHPTRNYLLGEKGTCEGCHIEIKEAMQGLWITDEEDPAGPDPMFRIIACDSCHQTKEDKVTFKKIRERCVECHNEAFGDLWDYRVEKYGTREKRPKDKDERALRLKQIHRFADFLEPDEEDED